MKTKTGKIVKAMVMAAVFAFAFAAHADTEKVGDWTWTYRIVDGEAEIYNDGDVAISPDPVGEDISVPSTLGGKTVTKIVYLNKYGRIAVEKADAMEQADAERVMKRFLCLYHAGMRKPLPFFPKASYACYAEADERKKKAKAESYWTGSMVSKGEVEKFGDFFGAELPFGDAFRMLAEAFFGAAVFRPEDSGKRKRERK